MESLRVAGGEGRQTTCMDARQVQLLNQQAEVLFGKEHLVEPNFVAPLPYPDKYNSPDEEELLGIEYALCQSTDFSAVRYYAEKVEEEQSREVEESDEGGHVESEDESEDEGVDVSEEEHLNTVSSQHVRLTKVEQVEEEESPALQDVMMTRSHMHLPGIEAVEALALLLLELADNSDHHLVSAKLRGMIVKATGALLDHDKTAAGFVKEYESRWGYTLFGRCLGADTPENRARQKTKFGWARYAQAAQVTQETRLLYLVIKMLKNRPPASTCLSPTKAVTKIKAQYQRIVDRVRDDPDLSKLSIPLPNINAKSISNFLQKEEKRANYLATAVPRVKDHRRVLCDYPMPEAPALPASIPVPPRPQVQYANLEHHAGERRGAKRRLEAKRPTEEGSRPIQPKPATYIPPRVAAAPVLIVVPQQPQAPSMLLPALSTSYSQVSAGFRPVAPPPVLPSKPVKPHKSLKPCGACQVPNCGGQRKRYTPHKDKLFGSSQKIFTYCPSTRKSLTAGFEGVVYESFEHFKRVVDEALEKSKTS
ncbi:uncharacterized protein LOC144874025 [Branchiostoma floridae x Branchiostoma japonicum]